MINAVYAHRYKPGGGPVQCNRDDHVFSGVNGRFFHLHHQQRGVFDQLKAARVIGLLVAVILLVEHVELIAVVHLPGEVDRDRVIVAGLRLRQPAVIRDGAGAVLDDRGDIFVLARLCAAVFYDPLIRIEVGVDELRLEIFVTFPDGAIAAVVEQRQLPVAAGVVADGGQRVGACGAGRFAAFGGGGEEDGSQIDPESGPDTVPVTVDRDTFLIDVAVPVDDSCTVITVAEGAEPPIAGRPVRMLRVNLSQGLIQSVRFFRGKRPQKLIFKIRVACDAVGVFSVIPAFFKGSRRDRRLLDRAESRGDTVDSRFECTAVVFVRIIVASVVEIRSSHISACQKRYRAGLACDALAVIADHTPRAAVAAVPHRRGGSRVEAVRKYGEIRRKRRYSGLYDLFQLAREVGLFIAVIRFVENIELVAVVHFAGKVDRRGLVAAGFRLAEPAVISDRAGAIHDDGGDIFVVAAFRAAVFDRPDVAGGAGVRRRKTAAVRVEKGQFPFAAGIAADRRECAFAFFAAFGGGREEDGLKIYPKSGTDRDKTDVNTFTAAIDEAVTVDTCSEVRIVAGRPQPPIAGRPARLLRVSLS